MKNKYNFFTLILSFSAVLLGFIQSAALQGERQALVTKKLCIINQTGLSYHGHAGGDGQTTDCFFGVAMLIGRDHAIA